MNERPILFSGPMVKALLSGEKTQTRRVVHLQLSPKAHSPFLGADGIWRWMTGRVSYKGDEIRCPYGAPGDRLWVRETWEFRPSWGARVTVIFGAGGEEKECEPPPDWNPTVWNRRQRWRPSIHMPRWASRVSLEVTEVRVQRVHEITEADAKAEGIADNHAEWSHEARELGIAPGLQTRREAFAITWNKLNGKREGCDWKSDPWVWALTFRRVAP